MDEISRKLSTAELAELHQRYEDDFYHISHKGVVNHVGMLLAHIEALNTEQQEIYLAAQEFADIMDRGLSVDRLVELDRAIVKITSVVRDARKATESTPGGA